MEPAGASREAVPRHTVKAQTWKRQESRQELTNSLQRAVHQTIQPVKIYFSNDFGSEM